MCSVMLKIPFVDYCLWQIIPTRMHHFKFWAAADHTGHLISAKGLMNICKQVYVTHFSFSPLEVCVGNLLD